MTPCHNNNNNNNNKNNNNNNKNNKVNPPAPLTAWWRRADLRSRNYHNNNNNNNNKNNKLHPPAPLTAWWRRADLRSRRSDSRTGVVVVVDGWPAAAGPSARGHTRLAALLPRPHHPRAAVRRPRPRPTARHLRHLRHLACCRAELPGSRRAGCQASRD